MPVGLVFTRGTAAGEPKETGDAGAEGSLTMELGVFSVSLTVKDLQASKAFYEKLGFTPFTGNGTNWLIMKNGTTVIGLFQGMFERNILTFNPGWDADARPLDRFTTCESCSGS
jgi:hypothetical protein